MKITPYFNNETKNNLIVHKHIEFQIIVGNFEDFTLHDFFFLIALHTRRHIQTRDQTYISDGSNSVNDKN
jgi:hypothetical protein